LAAARDTWREAYGGELDGQDARRTLTPLVRAHGFAEVCRRLKNYGQSVEARYASLHKFAQTFGSWNSVVRDCQPRHRTAGCITSDTTTYEEF
jgi:hypothetical protein